MSGKQYRSKNILQEKAAHFLVELRHIKRKGKGSKVSALLFVNLDTLFICLFPFGVKFNVLSNGSIENVKFFLLDICHCIGFLCKGKDSNVVG